MNGWLVISVHTLDDIPVRMLPTKEEAEKFALNMPPTTENPLETWDITSPICIKLLQFVDGIPQTPVTIIDFPDGPDEVDSPAPVPA